MVRWLKVGHVVRSRSRKRHDVVRCVGCFMPADVTDGGHLEDPCGDALPCPARYSLGPCGHPRYTSLGRMRDMRRIASGVIIGALLAGCAATSDPSGFTESLAFNGKTTQSASELQARLDAMHERFGIEPGSVADKDTEWLLLSISDNWATVDKLLGCIDASDGAELTAVATNCAAEFEAEWEEVMGD